MEEQKKQEQGSHSLIAEFIPYEIAFDMKSLGFNEPCFCFQLDEKGSLLTNGSSWQQRTNSDFVSKLINTETSCTIPTYSAAFRWFREKHSLFHVITITDLGKYEIGNPDFQSAIYSKDPVVITNMDKYKTYEEAESACIDQLIEICHDK